MSDTRLLLDGPELAPLVERAREVGGRVVKAERVRKGFGPFARNGYVVTVDVPGLSPQPGPAEPAGSAPAGPGAPTGRTAPQRRSVPDDAAAVRGTASGVAGLEALLAVADGIDGMGPVAPHGAASPGLLELPGPIVPPPPPPPPSTGSAVAETRDARSRGAAPAATPGTRRTVATSPAAPGGRQATTGRTERRWTRPTWQRVARPDASGDAPSVDASSDGAPSGDAPSGDALAPADDTRSTTTPGTARATAPRVPGKRRPARGPEAARRRSTILSPDRSGPDALTGLGVPSALVAPAAVDRTTALLTFAAHLPEPVAALLDRGSIVAVLGDAGPVRATCAQMAARAGDHPAEIVTVSGRPVPAGEPKRPAAGRRRVGTVRSATRLRQGRAGRLTILAVEAARTPEEREAVHAILTAFAPDQVWLALDARADRDQLAARLADLPVDRVDALAGQHAEQARRPGALLDLDVPLAWLDGLPATGVVWAYVLAEAARAAADEEEGGAAVPTA